MRLVDFLVHLLQTQADTLKRLAAFFGEEALLQMLETAGDIEHPPSSFQLHREWFEANPPNPVLVRSDSNASHQKLEGSVTEFKLPAFLEFHLWAYPFYRHLIEGSIDLHAKFKHSSQDSIEALVEEALKESKKWIQNLPIPPSVSQAAERAAWIPWLKFRANVLTQVGKRPIAPV